MTKTRKGRTAHIEKSACYSSNLQCLPQVVRLNIGSLDGGAPLGVCGALGTWYLAGAHGLLGASLETSMCFTFGPFSLLKSPKSEDL